MLWLSEVREARRLFRAFKARMAELVQEVISLPVICTLLLIKLESIVGHHTFMSVQQCWICTACMKMPGLQHTVHRKECALMALGCMSKQSTTSG